MAGKEIGHEFIRPSRQMFISAVARYPAEFLEERSGIFFYRTGREYGLSIFGLRNMGKARENGYMLRLKARAADQCY
ncbi:MULTISPECIES: hypothetical protein [unclassified Akkermansia]|uniref:hypothetical protein n=1 Tax=unclassified Akkermansia TaxID=2608915 RepID=UPI00122EADED|nr:MULTISPECIES: hypothetical protein [unclassified Akkermansia]KAA3162249.1 hypothetical protein F2A01_10205 [Akkermansia sp. BIOML-A60]KAA3164922.1 hypothetical protein F2A23_07855 [Akkermansia sp. BIOML-A63]KAA3170044.1 hypothetical protein F2A09_10020 [Akkermansia sp. BIOML-A57]KAA3171923.1 hypothetical protein F2A07_09270 [Akkermansia sp. BIOML-A61]KAA3175763.1 hypothetical protein F2A13_09700 [Akkermansia sp. BIOML-A59]KAA3176200.1 hypothetical protein F1989_10645 [Akkermansia sp. BIOML